MNARVALCSICTRSHMAYARTLLRSAKRWAPNVDRYLLIIDDVDRRFDSSAEFNVVRCLQVVDGVQFKQLTQRYNAAEVCFAMKPVLLRYLLEAGYEQVHYLDGDTWLVGPFDPVEQRLAGHSIQLTPHLRAPLPLDGRNPTELALLRSGTYNAGYVGVAGTGIALGFLDWWAQRVQRWGINEPRFGMSGDQKWLDPVAHLFPEVVVSPDLGVNAAYWNLAGRRLRKVGSGYQIDEEPLVFLHLSGFDPNKPTMLSRFQNRIDIPSHPVLSELAHSYAAEVIAAGLAEYSAIPYAYRHWWHSRRLPLRIARALLFHFREARLSHAAQALPAPPTIDAELAGIEMPRLVVNNIASSSSTTATSPTLPSRRTA